MNCNYNKKYLVLKENDDKHGNIQFPKSSLKSHMSFIKQIYSVKKQTGDINYFNCNCKTFPENIQELNSFS